MATSLGQIDVCWWFSWSRQPLKPEGWGGVCPVLVSPSAPKQQTKVGEQLVPGKPKWGAGRWTRSQGPSSENGVTGEQPTQVPGPLV